MAIRISAKNVKTIQFLKYVIDCVAKKENLKQYDGVEIRIEKGKTPFPEFQHYDNGLSPDHKALEVALKNNQDYDEKADVLARYLIENFKDSAKIALPKREKDKPLTFLLWIVINNPFEVFTLHEQIRTEKSDKNILKRKKTNNIPEFKENPPRIIWERKTIEIPPDSIEYETCKLSFDKTNGEQISWDEIAKNVDGLDKENIKTGRQSIYDAVNRINIKTKSAVNKELFKWTEKGFIKLM